MHERAMLTGDSRGFEALFDKALARVMELDEMPEQNNTYAGAAFDFARLGLLPKAQEWIQLHQDFIARTSKEETPFARLAVAYVGALGGEDIGAAINVIEEVIQEFGCDRCFRVELGQLHEMNGDTEAAIAAFQTFVDTKSFSALGTDEGTFAVIQFRLGTLFEDKGDLDQAITYYSRMAERWKDADAVLQPQVAEAKRRIEALLDRKAREGS
jgi:tetratricopeptide (TPR) repeat protein